MAKIAEWTAEDESEWLKWCDERPPVVQKIARRFRPNILYRLKTTGQRGVMYSISEDGTVTMDFPWAYNWISMMDLQVFGLDPNDIEECDDLSRHQVEIGGVLQ